MPDEGSRDLHQVWGMALVRFQDPEQRIEAGQVLDRIAERVVLMALKGDKDAIAEIGNRLDGKPRQEVDAAVETPFIVQWPMPRHRLQQMLDAEYHALGHNGSNTAHALSLVDSTEVPNA